MITMRTVIVRFDNQFVAQILLHAEHPDVRTRLIQWSIDSRRKDRKANDPSRGFV